MEILILIKISSKFKMLQIKTHISENLQFNWFYLFIKILQKTEKWRLSKAKNLGTLKEERNFGPGWTFLGFFRST